jgi:nitrogen regulatory protein P-II 1
MTVYKIEATVRPERLYDVKQALSEQREVNFTVTEIRDCGPGAHTHGTWRGVEYGVEFVRQMRVELQVADESVDPIVEAIVASAYTDTLDDGKIVVMPVSEVLDIHEAGRALGRPTLRTA